MNIFTLNVLAAEKPFYAGDCTSLNIPINDGQYGIMANHSNMIAAIIPGVLKFTTPDGTVVVAAVSEGIVKVENFDENAILLITEMGELTIKGDNLHISKMDVDTGDLSVTGNIYGLIYNETVKSGSIFKRLLR